jgi:hypothetical protein
MACPPDIRVSTGGVTLHTVVRIHSDFGPKFISTNPQETASNLRALRRVVGRCRKSRPIL